MKLSYVVILVIIFLFNINGILAQQDNHKHDSHDPHNYSIHHHENEIGIGVGWARILNESEDAPALHLHYLRTLGEKGRFSIGPGIEFLLDDHRHTSLVLSLGYRPVHQLYLAIAPGIAFPLEQHEQETEIEFAAHFEILYEFEFDFVHIGPMVEYAIGTEDQHVILALHLGFNF